MTLLPVASASAEIVRFTNGRLMTVDFCRFEGDSVTFVMRGGGEIKAPRDIVADVLPDEVPFARTVAVEALAASPTAARPRQSLTALKILVDRVAERVGLDARLAHAIVRTESNYEPFAISPKGAMGLMQLMPVLANQYSLADPFDPEANLEAGMRHLRGLLSRLDLRRAIAAYNAGETAVARYGGVPPYAETQTYVRRVIAALR
jgi:soluble lytic murein transglycosylase-like protein